MTQKFSELLKISVVCLENFIVHKDIIIFPSYDAKNFRIAHKFPDSNSTLLPGFFSLLLDSPAAVQLTNCWGITVKDVSDVPRATLRV